MEEPDEAAEGNENEEEAKEEAIPSIEYDYLLSMALWSLTEERINDLIKKMNEKKEEHDTLERLSIFDLWRTDIDKMLEVLEKIEAKEEEERLSAGGVNNDGKKKKKRAPVKDAVKAAA